MLLHCLPWQDGWPAEYKEDAEAGTNGKSALNPNHSHYILVDNGTQHMFGGEIDFRAKLEAAISKKYKENGEWREASTFHSAVLLYKM